MGTLSISNIVKFDGYLYAATEHGLAKLKASDGTLLKTTPLHGTACYVLHIAYGDGKSLSIPRPESTRLTL